MTSIGLVLAAVVLIGTSGVPAFLFPRTSRVGQATSTVLLVAGSILGLVGLAGALVAAETPAFRQALLLPWGEFSVAIDRLSACFLALVFVVPALASIYGLGYWRQAEHADNGRRLGLSYGVLVGSMALVVVARDAIVFLIAWELMALAAWFASTAESGKPEVRRAGWVYLVATHVGTLFLLAMFALWRSATGSFALAMSAQIDPSLAGGVFILALVGFGLKAGLMPLHLWLPGAHANAPSHVSAVMSGVMIKMGIYGIMRMSGLLPVAEASWGWILLCAGAFSGLVGIAYAIGQGDLKRILAYSSVENIGIIAMGIGLALLGRSCGRADLVLLGMGGALLHVWNHGLFKSLLFLDVGAVVHASGTRRIEALGGLAKTMPITSVLFVVGAVAISALPPLNGFVGEWLLYQGFFRVVGVDAVASLSAAAAGAAVLAMIGALAVAAFVRTYGATFLGSRRASPRVDPSATAHDPPATMMVPMVILALSCIAIGVLPGPAFALASETALAWGLVSVAQAPPAVDFAWLPLTALALVAISLPAFLFFGSRFRAKASPPTPTWDCGYAAPSARMQYTASSFGALLARAFGFVLLPQRRRPEIASVFPAPASFSSKYPDLVLDRLIRPLGRSLRRVVPRVRVLQQGQTQLYLVYILVATVILLVVGVGLS